MATKYDFDIIQQIIKNMKNNWYTTRAISTNEHMLLASDSITSQYDAFQGDWLYLKLISLWSASTYIPSHQDRICFRVFPWRVVALCQKVEVNCILIVSFWKMMATIFRRIYSPYDLSENHQHSYHPFQTGIILTEFRLLPFTSNPFSS